MEIHEQECRFEEQGVDLVGFASSDTSSGSSTLVSETTSDSDSSICDSGGSSDRFQMFGAGLVRLDQADSDREIISRRFLAGLGSLGKYTSVVAIHRNSKSSDSVKARALSLYVFSKAVEKKRGGVANVKLAWYAAASKEEIETIVSYGFCNSGKFQNSGLYGSGVYLSPDDSPLESVKSLKIGEDGLRHLLLCRVILGKAEVVHPGSVQCHPSSDEFDSGVDSVSNPKKYIVWSTHMNSHILPLYVLSFTAPSSLKGLVRTPEPPRKPTSPWMSFQALMSELTKFLPKQIMDVLAKYHKYYRERKMTRHEFILQMRLITGDKLLYAIIKAYKVEKPVGGNGSTDGNGYA